MSINWYYPRKRLQINDPRVVISQQLLSLNKFCVDKHFSGVERVKIGYEPDKKKLYIVPVGDEDRSGLKIITNVNSTSKYLNVKGVFYSFGLADQDKKIIPEIRGEYKCLPDDNSKGIVIDLKK